MVKCLGAVSCDVNIIGKLIHGALNGYNVRGSVPPNSDDRTCFSKAFVSTTMLLYRIRYYFVAVIGLGVTYSWHKVCQLALLPCKASSWSCREN